MRNLEIIEAQGRMFQLKRKIPESRINMDKFEDGISLLKQFYHVDTIFKAKGLFWFCNTIDDIEYEEIPNNLDSKK